MTMDFQNFSLDVAMLNFVAIHKGINATSGKYRNPWKLQLYNMQRHLKLMYFRFSNWSFLLGLLFNPLLGKKSSTCKPHKGPSINDVTPRGREGGTPKRWQEVTGGGTLFSVEVTSPQRSKIALSKWAVVVNKIYSFLIDEKNFYNGNIQSK